MLKTFEQFSNTITLYHGTCDIHGSLLIENGWGPNKVGSGANMGNPKYLYLSSEPEDALWFAQEKGCETVIKVKDIPLDYLRPDPEDEAGYTMNELISRMKRTGMPSKFVLFISLDKSHFSLYGNS